MKLVAYSHVTPGQPPVYVTDQDNLEDKGHFFESKTQAASFCLKNYGRLPEFEREETPKVFV